MAIDKDFKNLKTNLSGALTDAKPAIEKLGNTIGNTVSNVANKFVDIGSNFLDIGKMKRIKNTLKTVNNGVVSFKKNASPITTNPDGSVAPKDWRVSISVPSRIQEYMQEVMLLEKLFLILIVN